MLSGNCWCFTACFFDALWKQVTTALLNLIHQKSPHQHSDHMLMTMTKVMLKLIAWVLQGVKGFIFDTPTGASDPHDLHQTGFTAGKLRCLRKVAWDRYGDTSEGDSKRGSPSSLRTVFLSRLHSPYFYSGF